MYIGQRARSEANGNLTLQGILHVMFSSTEWKRVRVDLMTQLRCAVVTPDSISLIKGTRSAASRLRGLKTTCVTSVTHACHRTRSAASRLRVFRSNECNELITFFNDLTHVKWVTSIKPLLPIWFNSNDIDWIRHYPVKDGKIYKCNAQRTIDTMIKL